MRLRIIKRPSGIIPGVSLDRFEVGSICDVGPHVASVLLAEGWAEYVPESCSDLGPVGQPAIEGVVLVVDDEPETRRLTQMVLVLGGYQVMIARHGREAIRLLKDHCPDLVVLDLNMPVTNGWQFRAEQRHLSPRLAAVPVLVLSGEADASDHAAMLTASAVVMKPFEPEELLDAVRRAMGR